MDIKSGRLYEKGKEKEGERERTKEKKGSEIYTKSIRICIKSWKGEREKKKERERAY